MNRNKFLAKWQQPLSEGQFPNENYLFRARERAKNSKILLVIDCHVPFFDRDAGSKSTFQYLRLFVESGLHVQFIGDDFYRHEPYTSDLQNLGVEVLHGPKYAAGWRDWLRHYGDEIDCAYLHRP